MKKIKDFLKCINPAYYAVAILLITAVILTNTIKWGCLYEKTYYNFSLCNS